MNRYFPKEGWRKFTKPFYTAEELAEEFVETTDRWYSDPANQMFGFRELIRKDILNCLQNGFPQEGCFREFIESQLPDNKAELPSYIEKQKTTNALDYARMKFQQEWLHPSGMFVSEEDSQ